MMTPSITRPPRKRPSEAPPPRLLWTRTEAASRLNVSVSTIDRLLRQGELDTVRIGARRLVPDSELVTYIDRALRDGVGGRKA